MRYEAGKSSVIFPSGNEVELPSPLIAAIHGNNRFIALVQSNIETGSRNIFCYDLNGRLEWQIAPRKRFPELPYERLRQQPEGLCAVVQYGGTKVKIDPVSGALLEEREWKE